MFLIKNQSINHHCFFFKVDVHIDLLHVIAYGPTSAKIPAVNLFFFYWPTLNPTPADRKDIVDR